MIQWSVLWPAYELFSLPKIEGYASHAALYKFQFFRFVVGQSVVMDYFVSYNLCAINSNVITYIALYFFFSIDCEAIKVVVFGAFSRRIFSTL